jgi:phage tail sheath protein FI
MTEQILSAGVYTSENDQSFYGQGAIETSLALVGPTEKGPAFVPTDITSYGQFTAFFGADASDSYVPQTAYSYLQAGSTVKVTRILGNGGFSYDSTRKLAALVTGSTISTGCILAVFYPTKNDTSTVGVTGSATGLISGSMGFSFFAQSQSAGAGTGYFSSSFSASLNPSATNYLPKVLGTEANFKTGSVFPYLVFGNFVTSSQILYSGSLNATSSLIFSTGSCTFGSNTNSGGYSNASTPWMLSNAGGRLIKFHHRSDGFKSNRDVKIAIANITQGSTAEDYSTFDVIVRKWDDTDRLPSTIEQFSNLSLNPTALNYIGKIIGDKYYAYDQTLSRVIEYGDFDNKSNYIRVEIDQAVADGALYPQLYPNGYEAVYETVAGFNSLTANVQYYLPSASVLLSSTASVTYSGFSYANADNLNYLNPVPLEAVTGSNVSFTKPAADNKFILPMQGGNDGMNYTVIKKKGSDISATNLFGQDLSTAAKSGSVAYAKAIDILSSEEYVFDILAMPGVIEQYHPYTTDEAQTMVENRTDAVYLRDLTGVNASVATAVLTAADLDSSYSAAYYPWVKVKDVNTNKDIFVPPTVVVPQAYAYNDKVAAEWFAPAGLNRGGLGGAIDTRIRLSKADRDVLYQGRVNPIAKFQNTGVVIWGQKTLQVLDTALNRINVRRLLINLRTYIAGVANNYVFENNTQATRNKLINAITPYMENVQSREGLYAFRIDISDALNTNDVIDRNQLIGKIYVSPVKSIEFILLEFNITATGASFE